MIVRLEGITRHGKNRIREHGEYWKIVREESSVPALGNKSGILMEALDGDKRWITGHDDPNFKMVELPIELGWFGLDG